MNDRCDQSSFNMFVSPCPIHTTINPESTKTNFRRLKHYIYSSLCSLRSFAANQFVDGVILHPNHKWDMIMKTRAIKELCDIVRETAYAIHVYHGHGHLGKVYENARSTVCGRRASMSLSNIP